MFDLLSIYPAKLFEYLLAVSYLLAFIPFWKYVMTPAAAGVPVHVHAPQRAAEARPARAASRAAVPAPRPSPVGWFQVPIGVHLHPGHTWARVEADGTVTVGADDFAHKLVGPAKASLPALGATVAQGESAFAIGDGDGSVPMLSPVDGTVVAVNRAAAEREDLLDDPYGAGWLFQVKPRKLAANMPQLLEGAGANRFLEAASEALALRMSPELGRVLQDGGTPIDGIARAIAGDEWKALARRFFLT
jgi:glycine cleavage system H lipoate-binding protein